MLSAVSFLDLDCPGHYSVVGEVTEEEQKALEAKWDKNPGGNCLFVILLILSIPFGLFLGWYFQ